MNPKSKLPGFPYFKSAVNRGAGRVDLILLKKEVYGCTPKDQTLQFCLSKLDREIRVNSYPRRVS